ncbi:hypothetical protein [Microvirga sp. P5_D2]
MPPVQTLHSRHPVGTWQKAFVEGITTGHPSMPWFQLDPDQIACLIVISG